MYKPARISEFITPAVHKKPQVVENNGRTQKTFVEASKPQIRGKFKLKGTSEINANGLIVVNDKTSFITWWKNDFASGDVLNIGGSDYQIIGTPENVEMRGRYAVLNLEKIEGGA